MRFFFQRGKNNWQSVWRLAFLVVVLAGLRPEVARATHLRAGDIQAKVDTITGNPNHIFFRLTLYRNSLSGAAPQDEVTIYFGDGTRADKIPKVSEGPLSSDTNVLTFNFDHFYPGAGKYVISFVGENRVGGVANLTSSIGQTFYINSSVTINPAYGRNHSPVLRAPAIDKAAIGQVFLHNPAGYDADGDSLAYHLRPSQQVAGGTDVANVTNTPNPVDCTGFVYPNDPVILPRGVQVPYAGVPASAGGGAAIFVQDPLTGQITWNAPSRAGVYNVAFVVEEWRRTANGRLLIGTVIRDMQINVSATTNVPPTLTVPADVCVVAGTPVTLRVAATDGAGTGAQGGATPLTLFAYSGIIPPATFTQTSTGTSVTGTFNWTPDCSHVANQPYLVVFKVQDSPPTTGGASAPILIDEKPVRITVVGPAPQHVRVVPSTAATLTGLVSWDRYTCQNASRLLIFRREGAYPFTPGPCQTGLPAGSGYVQVGSVLPGVTTFADDNGGQGLSRGRQYCYRVYAVFPLPAGGASLVSNEDCLTFSGRSARLTNVDVNTTGTAGQITVKWTRPRPNTGSFTAPYGYRLGRAVGTSAAFAPIATITNLSDTTYVDTNLNTVANQYTYQLTFFSTNTSSGAAVEQTEIATPASSVRTSLVPNLDKSITVNWTYNVPWDNTKQPTRIFRQDRGTGAFAPVGTATPGASSGTFLDRDPQLQLGQQYCYYVQTNGQYADQAFLTNLLNNSQQVCTVLRATPCTPVLSIRPISCDSLAALPSFPADNQRYQNNLRWTVSSAPTGCSTAAAYYRILRSNSQTGGYVALDSTTRLDYVDRFLVKSSYCYVVQAVSDQGVRSALSNAACQDECAFFLLPNIFTPNGDGKNDVFRPKTASTVLRTRIQIFNRWGRKVYESDHDPYINWTGSVAGEGNTNGLVSGGLYYYLAEVQFADANTTRRTFKGWVEIVR